MSTELDRSRARLRKAVAEKRKTEAAWVQAIRAARDAGYSLRAIGEAAGISHAQVKNVLDGRYEGDPVKVKARTEARLALANGKLERQPCEVCGAEKVQMHHDDYSKPLNVRWLCFPHHRQLHDDERRRSKV